MTDLFLLQGDGSFQIKRVAHNGEYPTLIRSKGLKQAFSMQLNPILPEVHPDQVETWEELEGYEPRPLLSYSKTMMLGFVDNFWPLSFQESSPVADMAEAVRVDELGTALAAEKGSRTDLGTSAQTWGFILLIGGIGLVTALIVLGFLPTILDRYGFGPAGMLGLGMSGFMAQIAIPIRIPLGRRSRARMEPLPKVEYETLVLLTSLGADRVRVPVELLIQNLDIRCRYRPNTLGPWIIGVMLGLLSGPLITWILGFGVSWFIDPINAWLYGIAFSPVGFLAGPVLLTWWLLKSRFAPHPFWIAKRVEMKDSRFKSGMRVEIQPILPREGPHRSARSAFEVLEGRDLEDKFTTGKPLTAQLALAGMATTLVAMVIIAFILVTMWAEG